MTNDKNAPDLSTAYALDGPEDSRRLYRDWAETYDQTFAEARDYAYPRRIAALFDERKTGGDLPVLDIGCGTGLVAEALGARPVDGLDISAEMLNIAKGKGVYRNLIEGDLTTMLPIADDTYGGLISAGTFTHGHVGPEALEELIRISRANAFFALGVNAQVYLDLNFAEKLDQLTKVGRISKVEEVEGAIYAGSATHEHKDDTFLALVFRKL